MVSPSERGANGHSSGENGFRAFSGSDREIIGQSTSLRMVLDASISPIVINYYEPLVLVIDELKDNSSRDKLTAFIECIGEHIGIKGDVDVSEIIGNWFGASQEVIQQEFKRFTSGENGSRAIFHHIGASGVRKGFDPLTKDKRQSFFEKTQRPQVSLDTDPSLLSPAQQRMLLGVQTSELLESQSQEVVIFNGDGLDKRPVVYRQDFLEAGAGNQEALGVLRRGVEARVREFLRSQNVAPVDRAGWISKITDIAVNNMPEGLLQGKFTVNFDRWIPAAVLESLAKIAQGELKNTNVLDSDPQASLQLLQRYYPAFLTESQSKVVSFVNEGKTVEEIAFSYPANRVTISKIITKARRSLERLLLEKVGLRQVASYRDDVLSRLVKRGGFPAGLFLHRYYTFDSLVQGYNKTPYASYFIEDDMSTLSGAVSTSEYGRIIRNPANFEKRGDVFIISREKLDAVLGEIRGEDELRRFQERRVRSLYKLAKTETEYQRLLRAVRNGELTAYREKGERGKEVIYILPEVLATYREAHPGK